MLISVFIGGIIFIGGMIVGGIIGGIIGVKVLAGKLQRQTASSVLGDSGSGDVSWCSAR